MPDHKSGQIVPLILRIQNLRIVQSNYVWNSISLRTFILYFLSFINSFQLIWFFLYLPFKTYSFLWLVKRSEFLWCLEDKRNYKLQLPLPCDIYSFVTRNHQEINQYHRGIEVAQRYKRLKKGKWEEKFERFW